MNFETFLNPNGDFIDAVHFPQVVLSHPFYGKGIYLIEGRICIRLRYVRSEYPRKTTFYRGCLDQFNARKRHKILKQRRFALQSYRAVPLPASRNLPGTS